MKLAEKTELIQLLNTYQNELLEENNRNIRKKNTRYSADARHKEGYFPVNGIKAQYNHARCIVRKLNVEIEKQILSNNELW